MWFKRIQIALIHVAVTLTLLPMNSTLNRVMIKELVIPATLVALLVSLPYVFSPMQVAIGSYADRFPILGRRRTPYIVIGLALCVMGALLAPQAAFTLAADRAAGLLFAILAFGAWGMGFNFASVSYFSLASELWDEKGRSLTIATMFTLMIVSIIVMAIVIGDIVEPYSPEALQRAFYITAGIAVVLAAIGLLGLEPRFVPGESATDVRYSTAQMAGVLVGNPQARLFFIYLILMLAAILGQDVLLEPFAGQAFDMTVQQTTRITALWGSFMLLTLIGTGLLQRRIGKTAIARLGAALAMAGFVVIAGSGLIGSTVVFYLGVVTLGLGTGFATTSNLSLMLDMTTPANVGLYIGAWGLANAISRLIGSLTAGAVRDVATMLAENAVFGYVVVFGIQALLLFTSLVLLRRISVQDFRATAAGEEQERSFVEQVALMSEAQ